MRCFVIMPFGDPATDPDGARRSQILFTNWIKRAVESVPDPDLAGGFIQCTRADSSHATGSVIDDIVEQLVEADIVIADLTGRNANVFYELGVRHATNLNTILIARAKEDVPFDLRHLRRFFYEDEAESKLQLHDDIRAAVMDITRDRERIDNPVRRYLFDRESRKLRTTAGPPGYDVMRDVLSELSRMRREVSAELARIQGVVRTAARAEPQHDAETRRILASLQGVWRKRDEAGLYCARLVGDELFIPYSYGSGEDLDSHFYNIRVLGNALFARFAWFSGDISGVAFFTIVNDDELSGRWWYDADIPMDTVPDEEFLRENFERSHGIRLRRDSVIKQFPEWAERYFANPELRQWRPASSSS